MTQRLKSLTNTIDAMTSTVIKHLSIAVGGIHFWHISTKQLDKHGGSVAAVRSAVGSAVTTTDEEAVMVFSQVTMLFTPKIISQIQSAFTPHLNMLKFQQDYIFP